MKDKLKDVVIRALKTFWQGAVAYLVATFGAQMGSIDLFSIEALQEVGIGLLVGALAAGLSAAWNGVIAPNLEKLKAKGGATTNEGK